MLTCAFANQLQHPRPRARHRGGELFSIHPTLERRLEALGELSAQLGEAGGEPGGA